MIREKAIESMLKTKIKKNSIDDYEYMQAMFLYAAGWDSDSIKQMLGLTNKQIKELERRYYVNA